MKRSRRSPSGSFYFYINGVNASGFYIISVVPPPAFVSAIVTLGFSFVFSLPGSTLCHNRKGYENVGYMSDRFGYNLFCELHCIEDF